MIQCSDCEFKFKYDEKENLKPRVAENSYLLMDSSKAKKLKDLQRARITGCYQKIEIAVNELELLVKKMPEEQKEHFKKMIVKEYEVKTKVTERLSKRVRSIQ